MLRPKKNYVAELNTMLLNLKNKLITTKKTNKCNTKCRINDFIAGLRFEFELYKKILQHKKSYKLF